MRKYILQNVALYNFACIFIVSAKKCLLKEIWKQATI